MVITLVFFVSGLSFIIQTSLKEESVTIRSTGRKCLVSMVKDQGSLNSGSSSVTQSIIMLVTPRHLCMLSGKWSFWNWYMSSSFIKDNHLVGFITSSMFCCSPQGYSFFGQVGYIFQNVSVNWIFSTLFWYSYAVFLQNSSMLNSFASLMMKAFQNFFIYWLCLR
jgi:hypothetical protein